MLRSVNGIAPVALSAGLLFLAAANPLWAMGEKSGVARDAATQWVLEIGIEEDAQRMAQLTTSVDVWGYRLAEGIAIAAVSQEELEELTAAGWQIAIDPQRTAELRQPRSRLPGQTRGVDGFPCYRTVEETFADLSALAQQHPAIAAWVDFGDSWEKSSGFSAGYDMHALVLRNDAVPGPKAPFVLMAAMHAREYSTAELATRFAEHLLNGYGVDPELTWIVDHSEIHIVPQQNPDGRKQAETGLSWRKNTDNDHCPGSNSRGIDLNRNSTFLWGNAGASSSACSDVYRGPSAGSEPETQAIETLMATVFQDQRGTLMSDAAPSDTTGLFISLHSFGELVLYPWEAVGSLAPNSAGLVTLGRKFGFYNDYSVCQTCLSAASGTTVDQAYGVYGVPSYTFELGTNFFQSCSAFEDTILPDNLQALVYAAKSARRPYEEAAGPETFALALASGATTTLAAMADDGRYDSNGFGNEPVQPIAAAYYSIDTPPWQVVAGQAMSAVDGAFDGSQEAIEATLDTTGLAAGRHLVWVWAEDAAGNIGVPSAVFLDIFEPPLFFDGFETGDTTGWDATAP